MAAGKRILYFIKGLNPTEEEHAAAIALGTLTFRSSESFSERDFIEDCDGVAGCAPAAYTSRFPKVDEIVEAPKVEVPKDPPPPPPPPAAPPVTPPPAAPPPPLNPFAK